MTRIILVRHGETDWNKLHRLQGGRSDTLLNETGRRQAARLANRLAGEKIQAVFSSPLQRALHTAQAIAGPHQLVVRAEVNLREIDLGRLEGFPSADLTERFDTYVALNKQLIDNGHDCESIKAVQARAWQSLNTLAAGDPDGTLVVVTHYFVIVAVVCRVINLKPAKIDRLLLILATSTTFYFIKRNLKAES